MTQATRRMRPLLGTFVEVAVVGSPAAGEAEPAFEAAFGALAAAQRRWSVQDPESTLSRLSLSVGQAVAVDVATRRLLHLAQALMVRTQGLFDFTMGGLLTDLGVLPPVPGAPAWLPRGSADDVVLGPNWAMLQRPLRLTLDGIAKGYAVDLAVSAMRRAGVRSGWVNAGGDLRVFGDASLPVTRRELDGRLSPLGQLREAAMASSAVRPDGQLDAEWPGQVCAREGHHAAVGVWSVLARSAWRADALTKVAATCDAARRHETLSSLRGHLVEPAHARGEA